jgi:hemerythrin
MLDWSKDYETGIPLVDTQHKVLFENINKLENLVGNKAVTRPEVDRLVQFLATYAANHFTFEERCMQRYHCPAHKVNEAAHAKFLEVFGAWKVEYDRLGPTAALLQQLHATTSAWIRQHILKVDIQLRAVATAAV